MKIYTYINGTDQVLEFKSYIKTKELKNYTTWPGPIDNEILPDESFYVLDNTAKSFEVIENGTIPDSYVIKWDMMKIDDLFENRVIGRFNEGKLQWTLMNSYAMTPMIQVLMYGTKKYDRDNWSKACPKRLDLMDSLQRHADRKSTRLNSSHCDLSRMPSSA